MTVILRVLAGVLAALAVITPIAWLMIRAFYNDTGSWAEAFKLFGVMLILVFGICAAILLALFLIVFAATGTVPWK